MNIRENYPSFQDFTDQLSPLHFDKKDVDFQKATALKIGFQSWEDYLRFFYRISYDSIDLAGMYEEFVTGLKQNKTIALSFPLLLNKHLSKAILEEIEAFDVKLDALPVNVKDRFERFGGKLTNIYCLLFMDKLKNCIGDPELINAVFRDIEIQFSALNSVSIKGNPKIISVEDSFLLPNTNAFVKKHINPNHYFPSKKFLLKPLHDFLLEEEMIESNDDFEKTFELKAKPKNIKATLWLADGTELFYLLYLLNDNDEYVSGQRIDKIANQLFNFEVQKTDNTIGTSFSKSFKKYNDEEYIEKNMFRITSILQKLSS